MSKLIYIDTNVWISLFKKESDYLRPISEFSFELFRRSLNCEYDLLISNWLLNELKHTNFLSEAKEIIENFKMKNKLIIIYFDSQDLRTAKEYSLHWHDRLHEILAHKGGADFLVTRNLKDFTGDLIEIKLPENL